MIHFDPNNRPQFPTTVFDSHKQIVGTYIPYTGLIHPTLPGYQTPIKIVGCNAYDENGNLVGTFEDGVFRPLEH